MKYLGTSWKMNKTLQEAVEYVNLLRTSLIPGDNLQIFIVVPFTHLWQVRELTRDTPILLGAQNMHWADQGAYTGEISPSMLSEIGIDLVELGHSERRTYFGETDFTVNKKVLAARAHGLIPLVCVGDQKQDYDFGVTKEVIQRQVKIALHGIERMSDRPVWIAYEPVWAIGEGGIPADPDFAGEIHTVIREALGELFGTDQAAQIPILYGGSVNQDNAGQYLAQENVDGIFIGRSAWNVVSFLELIEKGKNYA